MTQGFVEDFLTAVVQLFVLKCNLKNYSCVYARKIATYTSNVVKFNTVFQLVLNIAVNDAHKMMYENHLLIKFTPPTSRERFLMHNKSNYKKNSSVIKSMLAGCHGRFFNFTCTQLLIINVKLIYAFMNGR